MFDITKLILKVPNFLSFKECNTLIKEFESTSFQDIDHERLVSSITNLSTVQNYEVASINFPSPNFSLIKSKTKTIIDYYINYLNSSNLFTKSINEYFKYSHYYRILKYSKGCKIDPHTDYHDFTYGSVTFNLNEDYEGGEFIFFNGSYKVSLKQGDALIFPAGYIWTHEVTEITSGTRYSVNSFIKSIPESVVKNVLNKKIELENEYLLNTSPDVILGPYN